MPCIVCGSTQERKKFTYSLTDFYECDNCALIRTLPFPSEDQIAEHYKKKFSDGNYQILLSNRERYADIYKGYIESLRKEIGSLQGKRLLDIGCFTGDFMDLAQGEGGITYGIELQKDAFDIAAEKHPGRILNCTFDKAAFEEKFDIITLFGVIEHLVNPEILLKMASDWLTEGGLILIQTPNTGSLIAKVLHKYWPPFAPIEHIHYFSKRNIKRLLESYHFANIKVKPHLKRLSVDYVYNMLRNFGIEFYHILTPFFKILPQSFRNKRLPFYIGEMLISARKLNRI